ncbi:MAG TPA: FeoB-associated Cys-rich membrane protein [Ruminococcus sp.]
MIANIILIAVLIVILGSASLYIYKAKKRGEHCIGCPYAKQCPSKGHCSESHSGKSSGKH